MTGARLGNNFTIISDTLSYFSEIYGFMTSYKQPVLLLLAILATAPLCLTPSNAATFSSNPVADSFVTTGASNNLSANNYGAAGLMGVSAPGQSQGEFQSVLRFDLAAAHAAFDAQYGAGGWSLQSVTLQLTATPPNNAIFNTPSAGQFNISWMQNDSWVEGTGTPNLPTMDGITFNSLQTTIGPNDEALGTFAFNGATSGSNIYALNLTPGFNADMLAGGLTSLRLFAANSSINYLFNSRNFGTVANRPVITLTAVPEPSSITLGVLGLLLLGGWKLRKRTIAGD